MVSKIKKLTQAKLKELLDYNPKAGIFTWKVQKNSRVSIGRVAGYVESDGYRRIRIDNNLFVASNLAWLYMEGYWPECVIDHKDRDRDNNKWDNLRHVSRLCNTRNQSVRKKSTSGVTGVHWCKTTKKWNAQIKISGKSYNLGYYKNLTDAVRARWHKEIENNYPNCNTISSAYQHLKKVGIV